MRKPINPIAAGGAPLYNDGLYNSILGDVWTVLEGIFNGTYNSADANGVIISGCQLTGAGPYNCSAGIVFLNGQFMAFPGFTAQTLPQYILPATLAQLPEIFADGVSRNFINQQDATFQNSIPGVQFITLDTRRLLFQRGVWTTIPLINSWAGQNFAFKVDSGGVVRFKGKLKGNTAATAAAFTAAGILPVPYYDGTTGSSTFPVTLHAAATLRLLSIDTLAAPGTGSILSFVNTDLIDFSGVSYVTTNV